MGGVSECWRNAKHPAFWYRMWQKISQTCSETQSCAPTHLGESSTSTPENQSRCETICVHTSSVAPKSEPRRSGEGDPTVAFAPWTHQKRWYFWITPQGILTLLVGFYRLTLSRILPNTCRFTPSCSVYAMEALGTHHFFRAIGLIIWRVLRCQPFCRGGYDPVPPPPNPTTQENPK